MGCPRCKPVQRPAPARSIAGVASAALPGAMLILMPKCPVCVAGIVAVATGVGVSVTAASYVRTGVIVVCAAWIVLAAAFVLRRLVR